MLLNCLVLSANVEYLFQVFPVCHWIVGSLNQFLLFLDKDDELLGPLLPFV